MNLDQKISQAIQEWLLEQSNPWAKRMAQDLNKLNTGKRIPLQALIIRNRGVHAEVMVVHNWVELLADSIVSSLGRMTEEEDL